MLDSLPEIELLELKISAMYIKKRLLPVIDSIDSESLFDFINTLKERFEDEISNLYFFIIDPTKIGYFFGDHICSNLQSSLPSVHMELKEASKCFAVSLYPACVFHSMRAIEVALNVVGKSLGILEIVKSKTWGVLLKKINDKFEEKKKSLSRQEEHFYEQVIAYLQAIRSAWRNPTMHVEAVYDEDTAQDIFNAANSFLKQVATQLKEE